MDIPNKRSSHSAPTPRGGGVAIVLSFVIGLLCFTIFESVDQTLALVFLGAGALVALLGFIDDHRHIAARWRLLVHFIAAGWLVFIFGGLPPLPVFGVTFHLAWSGYLLAALYLVWLLNLYNFMDGIDGIASIEAITVCLGGVVLYVLVGATHQNLVALLLLLAAVTGFLFWNFPRAKIFMGDAGSGFLGLMLGVFSVQAAWTEPDLFWSWIILLGVFLVDATVTLIKRILKGERFYQAHRSHAYQHAARQLNSHVRVTLSIGLINLFWLLPIAMLVAEQYIDGVVGVVIAYIPLIILVNLFKAGEKESQLV
jgi:Fuc2NAc and GlcNAc transferase